MRALGKRIMYLAVIGVTIFSWSERVSASVIVNGGFEADYTGWTLRKTAEEVTFGTVTVVNSGDTVTQGQDLMDYSSGEPIKQMADCLPLTFYGSEGANLAAMLQNGPVVTRMSQDITLPAEATALSWEMAYTNMHHKFIFDYQDLAIHIRNLDDVILATIFITDPDGHSPLSIPMTTFSADISDFAEQTVRLDVVVNVGADFMPVSFDNFRIEVAPLETLEDTLVVRPTLPPGWTKGKKTGWQGKTLPPGLEKQDKIPPGFENGQKNGFKK
jgi:hypothetical protein